MRKEAIQPTGEQLLWSGRTKKPQGKGMLAIKEENVGNHPQCYSLRKSERRERERE